MKTADDSAGDSCRCCSARARCHGAELVLDYLLDSADLFTRMKGQYGKSSSDQIRLDALVSASFGNLLLAGVDEAVGLGVGGAVAVVEAAGILKEPFASLLRQPFDEDAFVEVLKRMSKTDWEQIHKLAEISRKLVAEDKPKRMKQERPLQKEDEGHGD